MDMASILGGEIWKVPKCAATKIEHLLSSNKMNLEGYAQRHLHNYCKVTHRDIFLSILRSSPYSWFNSTWIQLRDNPITRCRNCSSDNRAANRKDRRFNPGKSNKSLGSRLNNSYHSTHVQVTCKTKYAIAEATYPNIPTDFCQLLEVGGDQWHMLPTLRDEFLNRWISV